MFLGDGVGVKTLLSWNSLSHSSPSTTRGAESGAAAAAARAAVAAAAAAVTCPA